MSNPTQNLGLDEIYVDASINGNLQKIDANVVNKNGTVPFVAEQIGVDPINEQGLATKHYVDTMFSVTTCYHEICADQVLPTSGIEYTLSFLPNDNGIYEVFLYGQALTGGQNPYPQISVTSNYMPAWVYLFGGYSASNYYAITGNGTAFTDNRKITLMGNSGGPIASVRCYAYRKIG